MLFAVTPSLEYTLENETPSGEDWNRHSVWIEQYIGGDLSPMLEYPPLFHFIMTPFYYFLRFPNIKYLQPIFSLFAILSIIYFSSKFMDLLGVLMTSFFLSTSVCFAQYAGGLLPQTLDYILFPLACLFLIKKRYKLSALLIFVLTGLHPTGIFFFMILLIYSFVTDKKMIKYLLVALLFGLLFSPSYLYMASVITQPASWIDGSMISRDFDVRFQIWTTPWDDFLTYPIEHFILFSGFLIWLLLPLMLWAMYKNPKYDKIQLLYVVWFVVFMPLIFMNVWRWWSYSVIPVSLFCGSVISNYMRLSNERKKI